MPRITLTHTANIAVVTLTNPPLNLVDPEMVDELEAAVAEVADLPLRALLLHADGENFSAGADVGRLFKGRSAEEARRLIRRFGVMASRFVDLPYPTVAAVQGMCLAAGMEIVLCCDMIWAGASSQFGLVEAVIGTVPLGGGGARLAQRVGTGRASEIVMTAGIYDAATCERWNLVNRVVPDDELRAKTLRFVERLAAGPTRAHAVTKRLMRTFVDSGLAASDALLPDLAGPLFESEDMRGGIESLLANGPGKAKFHGR